LEEDQVVDDKIVVESKVPSSPKLTALCARLERATLARNRADDRACSATAALSEAEEKEARARHEVNEEVKRLRALGA
jgi:hypothetical protein